MTDLTPFQAQDFTTPLRKGTTLLEASAGTGKTYALSAIYLRLILEADLRVHEILVTTFTVAATAELRGRIRALLRQTLDALGGRGTIDPLVLAVLEHWSEDSALLRARLTSALRDFDEAAIFTIHGFCQRVLSDRAFESATLAEQALLTDERELIAEVALDYWRHRFYECDDCLSAAAAVSGLNVGQLEEVLSLRLRQPSAVILPPSTPGDLDTLCCEISTAFEECRACWTAEESALRSVFSAGGNAWAKYGHGKPEEVRARLEAISKCFSGSGISAEGHAAFEFFAQPAVAKNTRKGHPTPALHFFRACEQLQAGSDRFATAVQLDFLHWAPPRLAEKKARLGVQSYGDLLTQLHASLHGLGGELMVEAVRGRYQAALVDEFQDTDPVQDEIFDRLFGTGDSWLFLIGDPKQAIYGFRGADVFTYLRAAQRVGPERSHTLGTNYRSAEKLVRATNAIFSQGPHSFVLKPLLFHPVESCGEREEEHFSGDAHTAPLRIWQWEGEPDGSIGDVRREIIAATGAEIARLLTGPARLGDCPVAPHDIAVLTTRNEDARAVQRALRQFGVPSVLLESESVFRSPEAADMHALLSAVVRPGDERLLRGALLTQALGLDFTELEALSRDETSRERWVTLFQEWHSTWLRRGFMTMFQRLLREGGVLQRLLARQEGERRLTNLLHLSELLQQAALAERLGPRGLVKRLAQEISSPSGESAEHEVRLERDDEAVRVVTIHKAKGLEYNIVFCPLLIRNPERREKSVRLHDEKTNALLIDLGSPEQEQHREQAGRELLADDVRMLYVALTRARQRCDFVWGPYKDADVSALGWLLHPSPAGSGVTSKGQSAHVLGLQEEQRATELARLVEQSGDTIALHPLPALHAPFYRPAAPGQEPLVARAFRGSIVHDYQVSSFSSLAEAHNPELPDYDLPRPEALAPELEGPPEGMHAFPGGTRTGIFMHEIFEELDFTDDAALEPLVRQKLAAYSYSVPQWGETVSECVRRTLQLPLKDGFCLGGIPSVKRLVEVEFFLPAGQLEAAPLGKILADEELALDFTSRQGWLKGFIDLVVEHEGRYYIIDWKTNRLGDRASAYGPEGTKRAMVSHRYGLQLHLYTLALHRYLQQRVRGYSYERHFGGAYYLFLRGLDPKQPELGVVRRRPSTKTVAALEKWLGNQQTELFA